MVVNFFSSIIAKGTGFWLLTNAYGVVIWLDNQTRGLQLPGRKPY